MRARCWRRSSPGTWWGTCRRCSGWPMRTAGTGLGHPGYEESARYVEEQLRAAGYEPVRQASRSRRTAGAASRWSVQHPGRHRGSCRAACWWSARTWTRCEEGPGINDNGSGVAAVLEVARRLKEAGRRVAGPGPVRVLGRRGGRNARLAALRRELSGAESAAHAAYLNVDVVGSPNGVAFVYDGDGSDSEEAGPEGSGADRGQVFFGTSRSAEGVEARRLGSSRIRTTTRSY